IDAIETIHVDHCIGDLIDQRSHERRDPAACAHQETRGLGAEGVTRDHARLGHARPQRRLRMRGPDTTMFDAERAAAGTCGYVTRVVWPFEGEGNVAAMATASDVHNDNIPILFILDREAKSHLHTPR